MSVVELLPPTDEMIQFIADNMRHEDAVEVMALAGMTPLEALEESFGNSAYSLIVVIDGIPLTALGLVKPMILGGVGIPWLLSAEQALEHRKKFLELSPPVIDEMLTICPKLVNFVHSENRLSIRWLKWLGFTVEDALPMGRNGAMFHRFYKER